MEFEFDPAKSGSILAKHQINFVEAQQLWTDQFAVVADARSDSEPRSALIARYQGRIWTVFFTQRAGKIRLISVRRARQNEEILYHEGRTTG